MFHFTCHPRTTLQTNISISQDKGACLYLSCSALRVQPKYKFIFVFCSRTEDSLRLIRSVTMLGKTYSADWQWHSALINAIMVSDCTTVSNTHGVSVFIRKVFDEGEGSRVEMAITAFSIENLPLNQLVLTSYHNSK